MEVRSGSLHASDVDDDPAYLCPVLHPLRETIGMKRIVWLLLMMLIIGADRRRTGPLPFLHESG